MSLSLKFFLPILLSFSMFALGLDTYWAPHHVANEKEKFIKIQKVLLASVSPTITQYLLGRDYAELHTILDIEFEMHKSLWKRLELYSKDNAQIYPLDKYHEEDGNGYLLLSHPLQFNNETLGTLSVLVDWNEEAKKIEKIVTDIELLGLGLLVVITFIVMLSHILWIKKPISSLKLAAEKLANGDFSAQLPNHSNDELGRLILAFDSMRERVQFAKADLELAMTNVVDREKRYRTILDTVPDAIITINDNGQIDTFNFGAEKMFGYKSTEVRGKDVKMIMSNADIHKKENFLMHQIQKSEEVNNQDEAVFYAKRKSGEEFPVQLHINSLNIDDNQIYMGVLHDLTENWRIEKLKNEFVATVSHELRTPLTSIKGSLGLIQGGTQGELPEKAASLLDIACRNVDRLMLLVNDILDVSRLESGNMSFVVESIEVVSFVKNIIEENLAYATQYNTYFKLVDIKEFGLYINADKNRLSQVLENLLSNAAKFSSANQAVLISVEAQDEFVQINIKDSGPGIPKDSLDKIFDKFTQIESGNLRTVGGTGLGLNISKLIMEKLHGEIGCNSIVGKGSTFYIRLPIDASNAILKTAVSE